MYRYVYWHVFNTSVERTGWEDEEGELLSTWESSRNVRSWDRETVGALGSGLKGRQAQEMWWWVFAGVCLVKKRHFQTASHPHALVLVRGSNLPWMGWKATQQDTRAALLELILTARRIMSGKRRLGAANSEVFVCLEHKPAKNSKLRGSDHLLKVRCVLKSFSGSEPLLAINIYTGKKSRQIGYNASREQIESWTLHMRFCALTWWSTHNNNVCFKCAIFHVNAINRRQTGQRIVSYLLIENRRV